VCKGASHRLKRGRRIAKGPARWRVS
jgi:hypothetical protein